MTKKQMLSYLTNESCYYEMQYDIMATWSIAKLRSEVEAWQKCLEDMNRL